MAVWSKVQGLLVGSAIGRAVSQAVEPAIEPARQNAWARRPYAVLEPGTAARAAVRDIQHGVDYSDDAKRNGIGAHRWAVLSQLEREYPGVAETLHLWRRGRIDHDGALQWLRYQGFSNDVSEDLLSLKDSWLESEAIANAIQQGFIPDPGYLPPPPTGPPPWTPAVEEVDIDGKKQAAGAGTSDDELRVLTQLSGNPPGPETLLELWRREIVTEEGVDRGIREGRTKTKWSPALKRLKNHLLSPATVINLLLRGWIDKDEADRRMGHLGYSSAQTQDWYNSAGRPMAPVQAFTAFFRGAPSPTGSGRFTEADFYNAIRRSDIRPEYGPALWAIRYAYPSAFQLRGAVQAGGITRDRAITILEYNRWEPQDATAVVDSWLASKTASTRDLTAGEWATDFEGGYLTELQYRAKLEALGFDPEEVNAKIALADARRVRTARTARVNRIRASYVGHKITRAEAEAALQETAISPAARALLLVEWDGEREVNVATLTAAQVKRAYVKGVYSRARAFAELQERGWRDDDANTFLSS